VRVSPNGVYLSVNDHLQFDTGSGPVSASDAMEAVGVVWDDSMERSQVIVKHVLGLV
jgi:hypothetical protein